MLSMTLRSLLFTVFSLAVSGSAVAESQNHQAAQVASPEHYTVLHENEHVLVLKMVLNPGQSDAMHKHHNETVYFQNGGNLRITQLNGEIIQADVPDSHLMWHQAWTHQVTNSGNDEVVAIIVEEKP